jgi:hypothetical protein
MATMNFSIPDDVKMAFNREFSGQNKSAIVTRHMRQAVEEAERERRREAAFRQLTAARRHRNSLTDDEIRQAREYGRP